MEFTWKIKGAKMTVYVAGSLIGLIIACVCLYVRVVYLEEQLSLLKRYLKVLKVDYKKIQEALDIALEAQEEINCTLSKLLTGKDNQHDRFESD